MKDGSSMEEQWNFFTFSWQQYKAISNIDGHKKERLGGCLGDTVAGMVFARHSDKTYKELTEEELLKEAKQLVVKSHNKLAHRLKLTSMVQGGDESITSFETRLKPVARTGKFQVPESGASLTRGSRGKWQPVVNPATAVPGMFNNFVTSHVEFRSGGRCPA